jgi:hypothetical protein
MGQLRDRMEQDLKLKGNQIWWDSLSKRAVPWNRSRASSHARTEWPRESCPRAMTSIMPTPGLCRLTRLRPASGQTGRGGLRE